MKRHEDEGFTLIELLIAVTLMGMVMAALTSAMIVAFRTVDSTRETVTDSARAQLLSAYLVSDAQSADQVMPTDACTSSPILELRWTDADKSGTTDVVYNTEADGTGGFRLVRYQYSVASGGGCTQTAIKTLVQTVDQAGTKAACNPTPCNDSTVQINLHVTALSNVPGTKSGFYSKYEFDLSGTRRTQ